MKTIDPNSRTQRILRFVAASEKPVTHGAIVANLRTHPNDANVKDLGNKVSAHLCGLVDAGKLKRTGVKHDYLYQRTATTLSAQPRAERVTSPKQAPVVPSQPRRVGEARVAEKPAPFVVPNAALTPPRLGQIGSEQIAADIAAFLARGGRIQTFKAGESSQTVRQQQEAFLAARSRKRAKASASAAVERNRADNDESFDADDQVDVA